jgi:hypothetical protein
MSDGNDGDAVRPGDGDSGDGGKESKITLDTPGVRELVEAEKAALLEKNKELLGEKRTAKEALEALQAKWKGMDPEKVHALMQRFENDEEAKLIAEGKFEDVIARRMETKLSPLERQIETLTTQVGEKDAEIQERDTKISNMVFDRVITEAAADEELGVQGTALPDITIRARAVFTKLDENLVPVSPEYGLKGVEGVKEWMKTKLRTEAPHCFKPSKGGGSVGSVHGDRPEKNPFAKDSFDFDAATKLYKEDPERARQLEKEAERASA